MQALLEFKNVAKHFPLRLSFLERLITARSRPVVHAVNGVSLKIFENETLGLVGESGSGKSTLGRLGIRLIEPTSGSVFYKEKEMGKAGDTLLRKLRKEMQIIFQNPYSSLNPRKPVRQILGAALEVGGINDPQEKEETICNLLRRVSLPERFIEAYPHQLSGGQRQRISILRALAVNPKLVVADEPVSALDVSVQAQILRLLEELKEEFRLTYLFIAHDLRVVWYISDRVAVMYLGKVMELGPAAEIFMAPAHPYTRALISAIPDLSARRNTKSRTVLQGTVPSPLKPPPGCPFHPRCPEAEPRLCSAQRPVMREVSPGHFVSCLKAH
jgi:oligopeptide/dipeptide ABC transporter ATP-binding protein